MFYLQTRKLNTLKEIFIEVEEKHLPIKHFPNGELVCQMDNHDFNQQKENGKPYVVIRWDVLNQENKVSLSDEIMFLNLLVSAIRNHHSMIDENQKVDIYLLMNMLPYARQDRNTGNTSVSNKVFIQMLNGLGFVKIMVNDIHSDASRVLFDDGLLQEQKQEDCFVNLIKQKQMDKEKYPTQSEKEKKLIHAFSQSHLFDENEHLIVLISPDAGAYKKVFDVGNKINQINPSLQPLIITAQKHRDLQTGEITHTHINLIDELARNKPNYLNKKVCLMVIDDICDGGRTFIELAKAIEKDIELHNGDSSQFIKILYVTHGLFSKGKQILNEHYDFIWAYDEKVEK